MEISDTLLCLFTAQVEERGGSYVIEVPKRELELGDVTPGDVYRVAMLTAAEERAEARDDRGGRDEADRSLPEPPVSEGDIREVEIEDIGAQGDGIARVERGYIVFVPGTDVGDEATIEITSVTDNYAFGEVVTGTDDDEPWTGE